MIKFHAVMIDETGCEFGAEVEAETRAEAYDILCENYPESRCDQLESPEDTYARESAIYHHISRGGDWDEDGRPIYPAGYEYDDEYDDYDDYEEEAEDIWEEDMEMAEESETK